MNKIKITQEQIMAQRNFYSKPILIGKRIAVKVLTTYNKHFNVLDKYKDEERTVISIEPNSIFGDGAHPTTAMCIEAIENNIQPNMNILDIGCGTGIQSIAALLLGAKSATAIDINSSAIKTANNNAKLNGVQDSFSAYTGNLTEGLEGTYDIVVANLLVDSILQLISTLPNFIKQDSTVIISGVPIEKDIEVLKTFEEKFSIVDKKIKENWVCYVLKLK